MDSAEHCALLPLLVMSLLSKMHFVLTNIWHLYYFCSGKNAGHIVSFIAEWGVAMPVSVAQ